jgi:hypothetical protein
MPAMTVANARSAPHIINTEPELRGRARASYYPFERVLAEAIGKDLGQSANSLIPRLAALSAVAGLRELYESDEAQALAAPQRRRTAQARGHGDPLHPGRRRWSPVTAGTAAATRRLLAWPHRHNQTGII